jgi:hypothetical protein
MLRFHHVGCAVASIESALEFYRPLFPKISSPIAVSSQGVNVCLVETGAGIFTELVEPAAADSPVKNLVKKGFTYYHIGYVASDFDAAMALLVDLGYRPQSTFHSEAFGERRCCFFTSPVMHMIELIEE